MFRPLAARFHPGTLASLLVVLALVSPAPAAGQAAPDLTDAEVAHVAVTANAIDIELAKFAQPRARAESVRRFAGTMITDHTAVNEQAAALAGRLGVTPVENAVSRSLTDGAAAARAALDAVSGDAFDRAYMDREVAYHQAVLNAIDDVLVPTTTNAELRTLLTEVRPAIAAHLAHARSIRASLGSGS